MRFMIIKLIWSPNEWNPNVFPSSSIYYSTEVDSIAGKPYTAVRNSNYYPRGSGGGLIRWWNALISPSSVIGQMNGGGDE